MDIYKSIKKTVIDLGCTWDESNGIVTVITPAGKVWDFTIPMEKSDEKDGSFHFVGRGSWKR